MEETAMTAISTALTTAATTIATDGLAAIAAIIPVAAPIMGAFIVVRLGLKAIKLISGR